MHSVNKKMTHIQAELSSSHLFPFPLHLCPETLCLGHQSFARSLPHQLLHPRAWPNIRPTLSPPPMSTYKTTLQKLAASTQLGIEASPSALSKPVS